MKHYEYAGKIWIEKITFLRSSSERYSNASMYERMFGEGYIEINSPRGSEITELYPKTMKTGRHYTIDSLLQVIWGEASKELENTTKLYAKTEGDTSNDIDKLKKENEKLKTDAEIEKLKAENESLKKQLELLKSKKKN